MRLPPDLHDALRLDHKAGPITTLHIFDFDGTLVRTPAPEEGKPKYLAATGTPWKGGWWGREGSLSPPVVEQPFPQSRVVTTVFDELEQVVTASQTSVAVVVTGRIKHLRSPVLRILDDICTPRVAASGEQPPHSFLHHSAVFMHPGGSQSTLEFKTHLFTELLTSGPLLRCNVRHLHIWEDRKAHAETFATTFADQLRATTSVDTTVHFVPDSLP